MIRLPCPRCGAAGWRILVDSDDRDVVAHECLGCKFTLTPELLGDVKARDALFERLHSERAKRARPGTLKA